MADRILYLSVRIPVDSTADDVAEFCVDALTSWGGQFRPDDPLFNSVQVKDVRTNTKTYRLDVEGRELL